MHTPGQGSEHTQGPASHLTRRHMIGASAALALQAGGFTAQAKGAPGDTDLDFASASQAATAVRLRTISSRELTQRMLVRIQKYNPKLDALVNVLHDQAMRDAGRADAAQGHGDRLGPLHGVPIVIKDAFEIAGVPTTLGIEQLANYRPATDSEVVRRLRAAGAIILGNTNVSFLTGDWQSYNKLYGTTNNPWDASRTPGGSSGGSAAALAAGLAYFSPGTDRSGSLRLPASFCGVYAHKPSVSVVSLRGWAPTPPGSPPQVSDDISVAGPMGRSAGDLRLGMQVMGGPDGDQALAYRWTMPAPRRTRLKDYRVGFVLDDPNCPVDAPVRQALEDAIAALGKAGVQLKQGWPAGVDPAAQHKTYLYMLFLAQGAPPGMKADELRPLAAKADGSLPSIFAQSVVDPHSRYVDHVRDQLGARRAWQAAFRDIDVFLMPASFVAAFPHDHSEPMQARSLVTQAGPRPYLDLMFWNGIANLTGLPATAAPAGRTPQGLPVGMQILGPYLEDATPIDFAEQAADVLGGFVQPPGFG